MCVLVAQAVDIEPWTHSVPEDTLTLWSPTSQVLIFHFPKQDDFVNSPYKIQIAVSKIWNKHIKCRMRETLDHGLKHLCTQKHFNSADIQMCPKHEHLRETQEVLCLNHLIVWKLDHKTTMSFDWYCKWCWSSFTIICHLAFHFKDTDLNNLWKLVIDEGENALVCVSSTRRVRDG